jgi:FkbM family methyltransferase
MDATMLELGGYWAYYSLWFLKGSPGRRAIVLEPDPAHRALGERNAALNSLCPEFVAGFAAAAEGGAELFATESSGTIAVPRRSVPGLLDEHSIRFLDLLHCDAQGAELSVLESCLPLIREQRIGWCVVSTHAHQITGDPLTHQRCLALLERAGARVVAEHDVHESFSGDGLIVARVGSLPADWVPPALTYNRYSTSFFRNPAYDLAVALKRID